MGEMDIKTMHDTAETICKSIKIVLDIPAVIESPTLNISPPLAVINRYRSVEYKKRWYHQLGIDYFYHGEPDKKIQDTIKKTIETLGLTHSVWVQIDYKHINCHRIMIMSHGWSDIPDNKLLMTCTAFG